MVIDLYKSWRTLQSHYWIKSTVILLKGWILPIGGASSGRVCYNGATPSSFLRFWKKFESQKCFLSFSEPKDPRYRRKKVPDVYELIFFPEASLSMRSWPTVKKTLKKSWGHGNTSFGSNVQALYSTAWLRIKSLIKDEEACRRSQT